MAGGSHDWEALINHQTKLLKETKNLVAHTEKLLREAKSQSRNSNLVLGIAVITLLISALQFYITTN